jgi:hypothetical protein
MHSRLRGVAPALVLSVALAAPALAGPAVTTQWRKMDSSQEECLRRAESATRAAGFGDIERVGQSRFGTRGDYTSSIRCVTELNFAFLVVAGPSRSRTASHMDALAREFDR